MNFRPASVGGVGLRMFNQMPTLTPMFNPTIPPPSIPTSILQHCSPIGANQFQLQQTIRQQPVQIQQKQNAPTGSSKTTPMANDEIVVAEKEIKREAVDNEMQVKIMLDLCHTKNKKFSMGIKYG